MAELPDQIHDVISRHGGWTLAIEEEFERRLRERSDA
jgi:hypothetical protein